MTRTFRSLVTRGSIVVRALAAALVTMSFLIGTWAAQAADAPKHQSHVDAVVKAYLSLQQQLAGDKAEGLGAQFGKLREAAKPLTEVEDAKLKEQAQSIVKHSTAEPKNLEEARKAFKPISTAVIDLAKASPPNSDVAASLYEVSCPMAKANWIQTSKDVTNPYMGKEMLDCGKVEREIKTAKK